jgi:hypothetical protein
MIGTRHTFASYFALAVDTILKVLWREGYARGPQALVRLTYNRIRRLERRFNTLVAQWRAGALPAARSVQLPTPPPDFGPLRGSNPQREGDSNSSAGGAQRAAWAFPRRVAWVVRRLVPVTGPQCVGTLCLAWEDPEMAEFFAAAPQVGKILRPLAHMIGAPLPAWLKLPKRVRKPGLRRDAAAASRRRDERGEMIIPNRRLPAREQAEDAMRRSDATGKAIDVKKFTPEANGWFMHWPRDGNCPPPKIGYAGRRRRPPKDYRPPPNDWE